MTEEDQNVKFTELFVENEDELIELLEDFGFMSKDAKPLKVNYIRQEKETSKEQEE